MSCTISLRDQWQLGISISLDAFIHHNHIQSWYQQRYITTRQFNRLVSAVNDDDDDDEIDYFSVC